MLKGAKKDHVLDSVDLYSVRHRSLHLKYTMLHSGQVMLATLAINYYLCISKALLLFLQTVNLI